MSELWVSFHLEEFGLHWEKDEIIDLDMWRESCAWFGATGLICIHELGDKVKFNMAEKTDIQPPVELWTFRTQQAAEEAFHDAKWVYFDPRGSLLLTEIAHPQDSKVVYSFGPDSTGFKPAPEPAVRIPHVRRIGATWAFAAASVALYDRYLYRLVTRRPGRSEVPE